MTIRLTFELQLHADYHVGAGLRGGPTLDSLLLRDWDNAPLLRGSSLAGLIRDGLYDLIDLGRAQSAISALTSDAVENAHERVFGSHAAPKRWYFDSARPTVARKSDDRWGSQEVTRVRINPRTRRTAPNKLFTQEEGDSSLCFQFAASCYDSQTINQQDALLLIAATRMVRHIGSARRRGRGACTLTLVAAEGILVGVSAETLLETALTQFANSWLNVANQPQETHKTQQNIQAIPPLEKKRTHWRIVARTEDPVIISRRSQTANAFEGVQILTGTALLGALATRAAQTMGLGKRDVAPAEFITYFIRGGVQVSNLLPAKLKDKSLIPAIPMPKSLRGCELYPPFGVPKKSHAPYDGSTQHQICSNKIFGSSCGGRLKAQTGFLGLDGRKQTVAIREEAHIEINRKTQRVAEGQLYEYMGIEAGQMFVGEIQCDSAFANRVLSLTGLSLNSTGELRLGKATRRGYGRITVWLEPTDSSPVASQQFEKRIGSEKEITMLLLSDLIAGDSWLRFQQGFTKEWLQTALGIKDIMITEQFVSNRDIDAFNTHRRQPRWRDSAIEAGSVVRFTVDKITKDMLQLLQQAEHNGLGWRRGEGFGRIIFNHPVFKQQYSDASVVSCQGRRAFTKTTDQHLLQTVIVFSAEWQKIIDNSRKTDKRWGQVKAQHDAVARLLYLWRHRPFAELLAWLEQLGKPSSLWGDKTLVGRTGDPKLHPKSIKLLHDLLKQLINKPQEQQAVALELLAETVTTIARPHRSSSRGY